MINGQDGCTTVRIFIIQHSAGVWRLRHKVLEGEVKALLARSYTCLDASCLSHLCAHFSFELHKPPRWQGQQVSCLHWVDEDLKACPGQDHKGGDHASHTHILKWTKCLHHFCPKASLATGKMSGPYFVAEGVDACAKSLLLSPFTAQRHFGIQEPLAPENFT